MKCYFPTYSIFFICTVLAGEFTGVIRATAFKSPFDIAQGAFEQACFDHDISQLIGTQRYPYTPPIQYEILNPEEENARARYEKDWTCIVYIAADNDLRSFAIRNIKQMTQIGSNEYINILAHIDIRLTGNHKITRRYVIDRNKITHVNAHDPLTQQMDSGDPRTLISCCEWAICSYPARQYLLVLWNHGTGPLDPGSNRIINPSELFCFNPSTCKLELDRSLEFFDLLEEQSLHRGVCWDDSTGHYLTNQKLDNALREICTRFLHGKKFNIIAFDACLMSSLEIANIVKKYAHIMVASQEVELGTGWYYNEALSQFLSESPDPVSLAHHLVDAYARAYGAVTNDYTQAAINLDNISLLEENIHNVAQILLECIKEQRNNSVRNALKTSRNKFLCTHFEEPSYIDLHHFYTNLYDNLRLFSLHNTAHNASLVKKLATLLEEGKNLIRSSVLANNVGRNLSQAKGISIYFPERFVHMSYPQTPFAATNAWGKFIAHYLTS